MPTTSVLARSSDQTNDAGSIVVTEQDQLSAVRYRFRLEGKRMFGMLVSSHASGHSQSILGAIDNGLRQELLIWESLSDEALLDFEGSIG